MSLCPSEPARKRRCRRRDSQLERAISNVPPTLTSIQHEVHVQSHFVRQHHQPPEVEQVISNVLPTSIQQHDQQLPMFHPRPGRPSDVVKLTRLNQEKILSLNNRINNTNVNTAVTNSTSTTSSTDGLIQEKILSLNNRINNTNVNTAVTNSTNTGNQFEHIDMNDDEPSEYIHEPESEHLNISCVSGNTSDERQDDNHELEYENITESHLDGISYGIPNTYGESSCNCNQSSSTGATDHDPTQNNKSGNRKVLEDGYEPFNSWTQMVLAR
jgi:hypothetical protein